MVLMERILRLGQGEEGLQFDKATDIIAAFCRCCCTNGIFGL